MPLLDALRQDPTPSFFIKLFGEEGLSSKTAFYWSMLRHKFWLFEFISISQTILEAPVQYYRAFLHTETDDNDLNYFLLHQLEIISKAICQLHEYIRKKADELVKMHSLLHNRIGFNHRQLTLLRHALKHPAVSFTVASHQNSHRVVAQTSRNDLDELCGHGLLLKLKVGKACQYRPLGNLSEKLGRMTSGE